MSGRLRSRAFTFTIHNQGLYDPQKKQEFLDHVKSKFDVKQYIIAQELYPNFDKTALDSTKENDSHLQGNLYFPNQISIYSLLSHIQLKYKEERTEEGVLFRTQIIPIKRIAGHSTVAMDNYFKGKTKLGGDPNLLENMLTKEEKEFEIDFKNIMTWGRERANRIYQARINNQEREEEIKSFGWSNKEKLKLI